MNFLKIDEIQDSISKITSDKDIYDVEDFATAVIRYKDGSTTLLETSFSLNIKEDKGEIELFGTKGGVKLNPDVELYTEM